MLVSQLTSLRRTLPEVASFTISNPVEPKKLLGLHLIPTLNFSSHVKLLASAMKRRAKKLSTFPLSQNRKLRVIHTLLIPKLFILPLGIFSGDQLHQLQSSLKSAYRSAMGATKSLPTDALYKATSAGGLWLEPLLSVSTGRIVEHITSILNLPGPRGDSLRQHYKHIS